MNIQKKIIRPKDVLWNLNFHNFFLRSAWKFFCSLFRPSELRNDWWEKCLWVRESDSVTKTEVEKCFYLNMFKSALNSLHLFIDTVHQDDFLLFFENYNFYWFYCIYETANFWGGLQTLFKSNVYGFHGVNSLF